MIVGNRVRKDKVMTVDNALGTIEKITEGYVVVVWDKVNGHWHYTMDQAKSLEVLDE